MGACNCSMFSCALLYVHSSIAIILMGKRELVALLSLSSCCLVMVEWVFLPVPWGCLRFVIVVFPDHTHYYFSSDWFIPARTRLYGFNPASYKDNISLIQVRSDWRIKLSEYE